MASIIVSKLLRSPTLLQELGVTLDALNKPPLLMLQLLPTLVSDDAWEQLLLASLLQPAEENASTCPQEEEEEKLLTLLQELSLLLLPLLRSLLV
jgi:hypothetical protein